MKKILVTLFAATLSLSAWAQKYGLNPNDASDANGDITGDGYTNIEKYIHGIDPTKKVDWTNLENNHDTLLGRKSLL
ncbi:MAG: hypothetical protein IKU77_04320 [Alistipes sp.]|nr:hypothetical protein [Alistipes sp.]